MAKYNFNDKTEDGLSAMAMALVEKALTMGDIQTENTIDIEQWDLDRIFLKIDDVLYIIRTWNIHQTTDSIVIRWSLVCNGKELCSSVTTIFKIADFEESDKNQNDDGFTKSVAKGMAEQMLDAIEKKVKKQMGDLYDEVPENIAGLGGLHIEIKDDKDK